MRKFVQHLSAGAALSGVLIVATAGCDSATSKADKRVAASVADAHKKAKPADAIPIYEKAVAETTASAASRANANASLANAEIESANAVLEQIARNRNEMARILWNIGQVGSQV